jgi:hypothetical protein
MAHGIRSQKELEKTNGPPKKGSFSVFRIFTKLFSFRVTRDPRATHSRI